MARRTLDRHPKFKRLYRELKISRALARGHLEFWWDSAHDASNPVFESVTAVEACAEWEGKPGHLAAKLLDIGFADPGPDGSIIIHDYWDHCPDYVHKRLWRRQQREDLQKSKRQPLSAERRPDPDPRPVPQTRERSKADDRSRVIGGFEQRYFGSGGEALKRGGDPTHIAAAIENTLSGIQPQTSKPKGRKRPQVKDQNFFEWDRVQCAHFFISFDMAHGPDKAANLWQARCKKVSDREGGLQFLQELCAHIWYSLHPELGKDVGPINNIAAFANSETSQFLKPRKSA